MREITDMNRDDGFLLKYSGVEFEDVFNANKLYGGFDNE